MSRAFFCLVYALMVGPLGCLRGRACVLTLIRCCIQCTPCGINKHALKSEGLSENTTSCATMVLHNKQLLTWLGAHVALAGRKAPPKITFADAVTSAECSLDRPSFGPRDLARRTRWTLTSAAHPVSSPELIVRPRTLSPRPCQRASVRRASTRTDGHLMMGCGRERRAAANERLQHSGATQPPLSTQRAASCAQRCPTYHPVHVRFMLCASCADVMDKRYRGGATKLVCWRPLNMMW